MKTHRDPVERGEVQTVRSRYTVEQYEPRHAVAFSRFISLIWPQHDSSDGSSVPTDAQRKSPTFLFFKNEDIIGHVATLPVRFHLRKETIPAHWIVGFMVHPEHRNGLVGPYLIKKVKETLDMAMSLHVEDAVLRIVKQLGWKHIGVVPQYIQVLRAGELLRNISSVELASTRRNVWLRVAQKLLSYRPAQMTMAALIQIALAMWWYAKCWARPRVKEVSVVEEHEFDSSYDMLWQTVGQKFDATVARDKAYLLHRYGRHFKDHTVLACRKNGNLLGFMIVKVKQFKDDPRMGSLRMGTIVDCLFDPDDSQSVQALISASRERVVSRAAAVMFCTASHHTLRESLRANGFIRIPGNLNFAISDRHAIVPHDLPLSSYHLMRGDSDAADNF